MQLAEPRSSRWDLRGRLCGAELRIRPIFWASCVLLGVIFYQDPEFGGVAMFGLWIAAVLISVLAHELCHILAARMLGVRPRIVMGGLGGQVYGLEEMKRRRRVLVLGAGALGNILLAGIFWALADPEWNPLPIARLGREGALLLIHGVEMMMGINAAWAFLNLLPLWPLDGGRIAVEIGEALFGRRGQMLALLLSLTMCLFLGFSAVFPVRAILANPFDNRYLLRLSFVAIQLLYCYVLWLLAFRALWGEDTPLDDLSRSGRAA
jgi:stage IV sporulation protein FB